PTVALIWTIATHRKETLFISHSIPTLLPPTFSSFLLSDP
ncbi:unnamed protein product, partial [Brassica oleracea]